MKFTSVAFDLDGTLYPNHRLNLRLIPFIFKHYRLLSAMDKARKKIRYPGGKSAPIAPAGGNEPFEDFYDLQARLMGEILDMPAKKVKETVERLIYRGWEPIFKEVELFPHVRETLEIFREKGIRLGMLSDFPPVIKLENLKLSGFWHVALSSEETGQLKPSPTPFLELARKMETPVEQILYVGNSVPYDIEGARNAGMKAALILPSWLRWRKASQCGYADFVFSDYRQLCDFVIN